MDYDIPDREELACAMDTLEVRLARQGQYDGAVDVGSAAKRLRLDEEEITRLRASLAEAESTIGEQTDRIADLERAAVWALRMDAYISSTGVIVFNTGPETGGHKPFDGTDADLIRAALEAMGGE